MKKRKTVKKKAPKLSKYEKVTARKNEALKLINQMEKVSRQQERVIASWDKAETLHKQSGRRAIVDNFYSKQNKELEKQSDQLYDKFYRHMHKDFNVNKSQVNYADHAKYKNGFVDTKFVNDIYNDKLSRIKTRKR